MLTVETAAPRASDHSCVTQRPCCSADGTETQALLRCADEALIEYVGRLQSALHTLRTRVLDSQSGALTCTAGALVAVHAMLLRLHSIVVPNASGVCNGTTCPKCRRRLLILTHLCFLGRVSDWGASKPRAFPGRGRAWGRGSAGQRGERGRPAAAERRRRVGNLHRLATCKDSSCRLSIPCIEDGSLLWQQKRPPPTCWSWRCHSLHDPPMPGKEGLNSGAQQPQNRDPAGYMLDTRGWGVELERWHSVAFPWLPHSDFKRNTARHGASSTPTRQVNGELRDFHVGQPWKGRTFVTIRATHPDPYCTKAGRSISMHVAAAALTVHTYVIMRS